MTSSTHTPLSLMARMLLVTGLALMVLLGVVGYVLDQAFIDTVRRDEYNKVHDVALVLLSTLDKSHPMTPQAPEDWMKDLPTSHQMVVHVQAFGPDGKPLWGRLSTSSPMDLWPRHDETQNEQIPVLMETSSGFYYVWTQQLNWQGPLGSYPLVFQVAEPGYVFDKKVIDYRRVLVPSLMFTALLIVGLMWLFLKWSLHPVRHMEKRLMAMRQSHEVELHPSELPQEMQTVGLAMVDLLTEQRTQLERTRAVFADLSHSLRTPLAVMRSYLEQETEHRHPACLEQIQRMEQVITRQLSRAGGVVSWKLPGVDVLTHVEALAMGLEKLHARKGVFCEFDLEENVLFLGEEADLVDLLGNLLDNAFKWSQKRVLLHAHMLPSGPNGLPGLVISVEDDGPGIESKDIAHILTRGGRLDEQTPGHGLGLSLVHDLVMAYDAQLDIGRSSELGGARFTLTFEGR